MKTDRIFVLLLVVMLPMSGCFDGAVGDAEGSDESDGNGNNELSVNHPPVISAGIEPSIMYTEGDDCTTNGIEIHARHAMTDWDGQISQAGWDVDLDGNIDYFVTDSEGHTAVEILLDDLTYWNYTSGNNEIFARQKNIVFGAQDDSGQWTSSEIFLIEIDELYVHNGVYKTNLDVIPCAGSVNPMDYNFSVTDHPDEIDSGGDRLIQIEFLEGDYPIEWERIKIKLDGDVSPQRYCTLTYDSWCSIELSDGSLPSTNSLSMSWYPNQVITIKEQVNLQKTSGESMDVEIWIDDVLVDSLTLILE
ncbi:hypothetical protein OAO34_03325 [Candidatus Poseidoniaceae archaeon]|nr:hypothetical protein [Candidatus Poseidoniaceae archaeon]